MSALKFQADQTPAIWHNNPVLVQLLGLSPLVATSTTLVNGIAIALLTSIVLVCCSLTISACRSLLVQARWRFALFLFVLAAFTTVVDILLQRFNYALYRELGIYVPLIACNFILLLHLESHAQKTTTLVALHDAVMAAAGFSLAITVFSGIREWIIYGHVFGNWSLLLPSVAQGEANQTLADKSVQFAFARLAPAALILFGLLLALRNALMPLAAPANPESQEPVKRARVTGKIQPANKGLYE